MAERPSKRPIPFRSTKAEVAIAVTKAAVSAVPIAGGPAAELMSLLQAPLQKRHEDWWNDLAQRVDRLIPLEGGRFGAFTTVSIPRGGQRPPRGAAESS